MSEKTFPDKPNPSEQQQPWEVPSAGYAFRFHLAGVANAHISALLNLPSRVPEDARKDFTDAVYYLLYYLSDQQDRDTIAAEYTHGNTGQLLLHLQDRAARLKAQNNPRIQAYLDHQRKIASALPKDCSPGFSLYCASDFGNIPVVTGDRLPVRT